MMKGIYIYLCKKDANSGIQTSTLCVILEEVNMTKKEKRPSLLVITSEASNNPRISRYKAISWQIDSISNYTQDSDNRVEIDWN